MKYIAKLSVGVVGVAGSLILGACGTMTPIVPVGNGVYEVADSSATALSSGATQKIRLIQAAQKYCGKSGESARVVNATDTNGHVGSFAVFGARDAYGDAAKGGQRANADVQFRCQQAGSGNGN
ncbi:MAG TPA: hypothetical protein VF292_07485 [Rhodanobacteraceae bacterium]